MPLQAVSAVFEYCNTGSPRFQAKYTIDGIGEQAVKPNTHLDCKLDFQSHTMRLCPDEARVH